jgi:Ser/Thr protein kinase RdoA (MazF antagonist)
MGHELELETVLAHYDLGTVRALHRVDRGYVNETWMVTTTSGSFILRRRHPLLARPQLVTAQHALMQYLRTAGFPVPGIQRRQNDATFLTLGGRLYEVYEYLCGVACDVARPAHVAAAAYTLGRYHQAVVGFDHSALHRASARYSVLVLERTVRGLMHEWRDGMSAQVTRLCTSLTAHVADLWACRGTFQDLPELVVHGDYYAENLILRDDKVVGVVDYDQAHWCPRVLEVAEALLFFAREPEKRLEHIVYSGALDLGSVERFLAAYGGVIRLSDAEIRALPHFMRVIWMCAALDPPLEPRPSVEDAAQVLPEVLYLANWAQSHRSEIQEIGYAFRKVGSKGPDV